MFSKMIGNMRFAMCWSYPTLERACHVVRMPRAASRANPSSLSQRCPHLSSSLQAHHDAEAGILLHRPDDITAPTSKTPRSSKYCCYMRRVVVWRATHARIVASSSIRYPRSRNGAFSLRVLRRAWQLQRPYKISYPNTRVIVAA